uniref:Uncharacterized protein n=1 Tax=Arundo donax TaxID=35708 RepID=A0A0A9BDM5_ARUDO
MTYSAFRAFVVSSSLISHLFIPGSQCSMLHFHFLGRLEGFISYGRRRHFWHISQPTQCSSITTGAGSVGAAFAVDTLAGGGIRIFCSSEAVCLSCFALEEISLLEVPGISKSLSLSFFQDFSFGRRSPKPLPFSNISCSFPPEDPSGKLSLTSVCDFSLGFFPVWLDLDCTSLFHSLTEEE